MSQEPPRIGLQGYPLPPAYWELFTDEAREDPNHENHFVFTPPPPFDPQREYFFKHGEDQEPLTINQLAPRGMIPPHMVVPQDPPCYVLPPSVPDQFRSFDGLHLIRYHPDVDCKGELIRLNKLLAQQYTLMLQIISTPQPPSDDQNRNILFEEHSRVIQVIMADITHLTGLLREHQSQQQILAHVRKQTQMNKDKTQRLKSLHDKFETLLQPDCDVDDVIQQLNKNKKK